MYLRCGTRNKRSKTTMSQQTVRFPRQQMEISFHKFLVRFLVKFEIGGERDPRTPTNEEETQEETWECVWKCHTAAPVHHMAFSPDGTLFATSGKSDRLVKVWYENKHRKSSNASLVNYFVLMSLSVLVLFPSRTLEHNQSMGSFIGNPMELNYGFVYVAHPRAVTHISWRKTSKYMPKGSVSNMLVTSCLDNICRIWVETVLPDDGLVNMNQFDPLASQNPKFRTHRHKHRFMQRLKHMKTCFHIRRHAKHQAGTGLSGMAAGFGGLGTSNGFGQPPIPTLPSTYSVHDFHSYGYHGTGVTPGLHFHLAASINAETDIPLVPSMQTNDPATQPNFILHWLNNKEMHFSLQAEGIMHEMARKFMEKEDVNNIQTGDNSNSEHSDDHHGGVAPDEVKRKLNKMNKSMSHEESQHSDEVHPQQQQQHANRSHSIGAGSHGATVPPSHTLSNTTSIQSLMTDGQTAQSGQNGANVGTDSLDMKIECLLRDWHHNPDLLFSIHPIDGSFLIWVIEWLDEYHPGAFRQAQVSFSTRIPAAFPLGDAMSMSTTVSLYSSGINYLHFRDMVIKGATKAGSTPKENSTKDQVEGDTGTPLPSVQEEQDADEHAENDEDAEEKKPGHVSPNDSGNVNDAGCNHSPNDLLMAPPSPSISMVTKHANGTLNLWQLTFADKSKFSQVLSIGHASRASGHRFRVNDITCHPVLPLLLTTSHHNVPELSNQEDSDGSSPRLTDKLGRSKDVCAPSGFCSELILWRVDAVGPLSQSGGVSELARINSPEISAFSNVAWIPTLLPSTTLGNLSNSPSACFVASDGESLRVYQAVIDARTLLAEISSSERRHRLMTDSMMSLSTDCSSVNDAMLHHQSPLHDKIKIVSQQSTARPGCIIQLDAIDDATHDWQNTQFLHVFQEQLITGERTDSDSSGLIDTTGNEPIDPIGGLMEKEKDAMVDLQRNSVFEEPFYIVVLERTPKGTTVHMWRIVIASQPVSADELSSSMMYVPDSNIVQDLDEPEDVRAARQSTAGLADEHMKAAQNDYCPRVNISTTKVCTQELPLAEGVDVVHAAPAAGHLSSSSIYPACFAPYIIVTACSDSQVRFWKCKVSKKTENPTKFKYEWREWDMIRKDQESSIDINGQLLNISAAYSGRIACAYKYGKSFTRPTKADPESRYVNLCVAIYECESTGGSEWVLEDTIHLKNIHLPQVQVDPHLDLSYLYDQKSLAKKQRLQQVLHPFTHDDLARPAARPAGSQNSINNGDLTPDSLKAPGTGMLAVPSFSTLQSLRKSITEHGNTCPLTQKHLVQLDWVSKEDGSHILTVAVGSKIMLFTPVSSDLAQANMKAMKESQTTNRPLLRKASSLARPHFNDEIRWMKLRQIELSTADGLPPLPMQISWVRDGIFVAGMDSEMHVYSQWKPREYEQILHHHLESVDNFNDSRCLRDEDLRSLVTESNQRRLANVSSMPHLSRISTTNLQLFGGTQDKKKKNGQSNTDVPVSYDYMNDFGLFEASRIACPVLPQYHPKQLMELLNSGKIRWVKAILAHLVRCISGSCAVRGGGNEEESLNRQQVSQLQGVML